MKKLTAVERQVHVIHTKLRNEFRSLLHRLFLQNEREGRPKEDIDLAQEAYLYVRKQFFKICANRQIEKYEYHDPIMEDWMKFFYNGGEFKKFWNSGVYEGVTLYLGVV